jgi:cell division protein FtsX
VIRDIARQAWAQSPARVVGAIAAVPVVVIACWLLLVTLIVLGTP